MRVNKTVSSQVAPKIRERAASRQRIAAACLLLLALTGCGSGPQVPLGKPGHVKGFAGFVAAEEPRAALVARDALSAGGNAADAAAALGLALSVTLPSAASLGGGGACLLYDAPRDRIGALDFMPTGGAPGVARGLFALHAKYGRLRWEEIVVPAESLARFGAPASRALMRDAAAAPNTPAAAFFRNLKEGEPLTQIELAALLARLRVKGPGDLHAGESGEVFLSAAQGEGLPVGRAALRDMAPRWVEPEKRAVGDDVALLIPSASAAAATEGQGRTGFAVMDGSGSLVTCGLTMGRPFGSGRFAAGVLLTDLTGVPPPPMAVMANRHTKEPRLAVAAASKAAVEAAIGGREGRSPRKLEDLVVPGSDVNAVACRSGEPSRARCDAVTDPQGSGLSLAVGTD